MIYCRDADAQQLQTLHETLYDPFEWYSNEMLKRVSIPIGPGSCGHESDQQPFSK